MCKYAVVDLEMCNVPRIKRTEQFHYSKELIQIGAVLLDENYNKIDEFVSLVAPEFGVITPYIEKLTRISRKLACNAPSTTQALKSFTEWLPEDTVFIAWSENDERQIRHEIEGKNISIPKLNALIDNWIDCQKIFSKKMDSSKNYSLSEALNIADICYEDGAHDALVDAQNTAMLFKKMETEQEFKVSAYYSNEKNQTPSYSPFAELLKYKFAG